MNVKNEPEISAGQLSDDDVAIETVDLSAKDIGFLLGKGGHTKRKLERISSARFEFGNKSDHGQDGILRIIGNAEQRWCALEFVGWTCNMRTGDVMVDLRQHKHHCIAVEVPRECVGFVTGKRGASLREVEEEWGTFLFFAVDVHDSVYEDGSTKTKLLIFGRDRWGRRGSQLKVMAAIEMKLPGSYVQHDEHEQLKPSFLFQDDDENDDGSLFASEKQDIVVDGHAATPAAKNHDRHDVGERCTEQSHGIATAQRDAGSVRGTNDDEVFGTLTRALSDREYSYALGKQGSTKRKLAMASDCIIEYIGRLAFFCGTRAGRERALHYTNLLLSQRGDAHHGVAADAATPINIEVDVDTRSDVTVCLVPKDYIGFVRGTRGGSLREIEQESRTLCFCDSNTTGDGRVVCYSHDAQNRMHAIRLIKKRIDVKEQMDRRQHGGLHSDRSTGRPHGYADRGTGHDPERRYSGGHRGPRSVPSQQHSTGSAPSALLTAPPMRSGLLVSPAGPSPHHRAMDHTATDAHGYARDASRTHRPHTPSDGQDRRGWVDSDRNRHGGGRSPLRDNQSSLPVRGSRKADGDNGWDDRTRNRDKRRHDDDSDDDDSERGRTHWRDEKRQRSTHESPSHSTRHRHTDRPSRYEPSHRYGSARARGSPTPPRDDHDRSGRARW
eukprot:m.739259 g.739259  ORF g.739259 m.739259 type:complete len:667 (+) comp23106_c0_seq2:281-2281(+)